MLTGSDGEQIADDKIVEAMISHLTVRAVGMLMASFIVKLGVDSRSPNTLNVQSGDPELQDAKESLAFFAIEDTIRGKDKGLTLEGYANLVRDYPTFSTTKPDMDAETRQRVYALWYTQFAHFTNNQKQYYQVDNNPADTERYAKRAHVFMDLVFAEAFDSWFCNDDTRKSMKDNYPNTAGYWSNNILPGLDAEFNRTDRVVSNTNDAASINNNSFGLAAVASNKVNKNGAKSAKLLTQIAFP